MRLRFDACLFAAVLGLATAEAGAAMVEETFTVPVVVADRLGRAVYRHVVVTSFREPGQASYPVMVLNHGRAPDPDARRTVGRIRLQQPAAYFASLGFEVIVPTRIGYGATGGVDIENTGSCAQRDYEPVFRAAALQVLQVMRAVAQRPEVDGSRVVLLGQSFGGAISIAVAAQNPPGLRLAINFAGGAGGDPRLRPGNPCAPERMGDLFADYGARAHVPTLWIYAENDRYMGNYPLDWFSAFRGAGGEGQFKSVPAFGRDGHQLFASGFEIWKPLVDEALRGAGFAVPE